LAEEYEGRVIFIGVSNDDTVEDGKRYREEYDVPYALAHAPKVWALYRDPFRPSTVVIAPDGSEAARIDGPITVDSLRPELERVLEKT
jgi:hypothetical protein